MPVDVEYDDDEDDVEYDEVEDEQLQQRAEMKKKYKLKLLAQNWAFWLPAQGVMFALVPASYHIAFTSACGLVWNTLLSLLTLERIPEAKAELKRKKA